MNGILLSLPFWLLLALLLFGCSRENKQPEPMSIEKYGELRESIGYLNGFRACLDSESYKYTFAGTGDDTPQGRFDGADN